MVSRRTLAGKWRRQPDLKTVLYSSYVGRDEFAQAVEVRGCEKRPMSRDLRKMPEVGIDVQLCTLFAWTQNLKGIVPKPGDTWRLDMVDWTVVEVSEELLGQRWRLQCQRRAG